MLGVEDWTVTTTVSGPVLAGMVVNLAVAGWNLWKTYQAKAVAKSVAVKVNPVSNGFAKDMTTRLDRMEDLIIKQGEQITKVSDRLFDHITEERRS